MKRGNSRLFFVLLLAIIISLSFISASWFSDFFRITGNVLNSSEVLIEEDFGDLIWVDSDVLERNCELMELELGNDSHECDSYFGGYRNLNETGGYGDALFQVLVEIRDDEIADKEAVVQAIADFYVNDMGATLDIGEIIDSFGNSHLIYEVYIDTGEIRDTVILWVSGNNVIAVTLSWNNSITDEDIFNLPLQAYLEKYPSDLIYEEEEKADLIVQGVNFSDAEDNFYVSFCNNGNISSQGSFSIMLENNDTSYATSEDYNVPAPGECETSDAIDRDNIDFLFGDIIIATVDVNNSINESNEENNDLTVQCAGSGCLIYVEPSCEDNDLGADLYLKGVATHVSSLETVSGEDVCVDVNGTLMIKEYFCDVGGISFGTYECPWGCQDGACIPRNPIVDFGNKKGYAVDYQTTLFWQRQSVSGKTWSDARNYCEGLNLGGYIDWRLPTLEELKVLYPVSVGEGISGFLGESAVNGTPGWEIVGSIPEGNVVTGVGMRATGGDINRIRLQVRPLLGCTLGTTTSSLFGSGLERFIAAEETYVVTGVGAGCGDDCDITHLSITTQKLNFPCRLGDAENISSGSGNPERMQFASEGYVVTGVSARANPGDIKGLTLEYKPIGLTSNTKYLDIALGQNYWTVDREGGNASILKWIAGESIPETNIEPLTNQNSVICVRDGRITPEQSSGVGSCQLCREFKEDVSSFWERFFGITNSVTTGWDCVGFDDTELLTDFTGDVNSGDIFSLKIGCGDRRLDTCSLSARYADRNGRADAEWKSVNFNGLPLETEFVGDVNSDDDFDLSASCSNEVISENCEFCIRYADRNGRANASWECVALDGTGLLTDFVGDVNSDDDFDLKIRCDFEPAPNCIDNDNGDNLYVKGTCTNLSGGTYSDSCNGTALTEFSCGEGEEEGFECVSTEHTCPYGCLDGACLKKDELNDAYFVLSRQGDFDVLLTEMIGTNHEVSSVDFRNARFKMLVDLRLLSAITPTSGYTDEMISSSYDRYNFAQISSIQRHNYESYSDVDKVPESVFAGNRFEIDLFENESNVVDLTSETANDVYIFKEEKVDQFHGPGVIHSSRTEDSVETVSVSNATGGVYADDGIAYTYGNGAYIYADALGNLHFKYQTQNQNSRAIFMIGLLACECSPGEERCEGSNYLSCDDGCSIVNNGEVVGECGVVLPCRDTDDGLNYYIKGNVSGAINDSDWCFNETLLNEKYCIDSAISGTESYFCELGCSDGACIDCIDSDSGKDYSTSGNVFGRNILGGFANETDRCLGDTLVERVCTNGFVDSVFFDCPHGCSNSQCNTGVGCSVVFDENNSECGITLYNTQGVLLCSLANGSEYNFGLDNVSECGLGCSAGVCGVPSCVDYDLGAAENITKSNASDNLGNVVEDSCSNTNTLREGVCVNGEADSVSRTCEFGCSNGRCLGESSCNDTDTGLNYYVKGISVSCIGDDCITGENESCVDGNNLWESYCGRNDEIIWQQFFCPEGCVNGACNIPQARPNATCASVTVGGPEIKPGIRIVVQGQLSYCDPFTLTYLPVKESGDSCMNDFECSNNACVEGECYSVRTELATQREILEEQTGILQEIRCWIRSLVGVQTYEECLSESIGS